MFVIMKNYWIAFEGGQESVSFICSSLRWSWGQDHHLWKVPYYQQCNQGVHHNYTPVRYNHRFAIKSMNPWIKSIAYKGMPLG